MPYCKAYLTDTTILRNSRVFTLAYSLMPLERQKKIDQFRFEEGKLLALGAGLMLRQACLDANLNPKEEIAYSSTGKPEFKNHSNLHFNISHSGKYALCMISDCNIGCDIQLIGKARLDMASRFFSEEENLQLQNCKSLQDRDLLFNKLWTLKESFVKVLGKGIDDDFGKFSILCIPYIEVKQTFNNNSYTFGSLNFDKDYCASYCLETNSSFDVRTYLYFTADKLDLIR